MLGAGATLTARRAASRRPLRRYSRAMHNRPGGGPQRVHRTAWRTACHCRCIVHCAAMALPMSTLLHAPHASMSISGGWLARGAMRSPPLARVCTARADGAAQCSKASTCGLQARQQLPRMCTGASTSPSQTGARVHAGWPPRRHHLPRQQRDLADGTCQRWAPYALGALACVASSALTIFCSSTMKARMTRVRVHVAQREPPYGWLTVRSEGAMSLYL